MQNASRAISGANGSVNGVGVCKLEKRSLPPHWTTTLSNISTVEMLSILLLHAISGIEHSFVVPNF